MKTEVSPRHGVERAPDAGEEAPEISILAVVVLYGVLPESSVSLKSLLHAAKLAETSGLRTSVLVFDNTPGVQAPMVLPEGVRYHGTGTNIGLAQAYNHALATALEESDEWLLTLDQDTELPPEFLLRSGAILRQVSGRPEIAAVVPQIRMAGRVLSPHVLAPHGSMRPLPHGWSGVPELPVYAFNSGSLLRVSALRQAEGYNPRFWLDGSDTDIFHRLRELGKRVYVASDVAVEHGFAMLDQERRVSAERYRNVLLAESAVWDLHLGWLPGLDRTARIGLRWLRYLLRGQGDLRRLTAEALALRLFRSRSYRLARWRLLTEPWLPAKGKPATLATKPKISVCMAAYNGERYIVEQLASILAQLGEADEIIVVDDASRDRTVRSAVDLGDPRIRIVQHERNYGVVRSFEDALRHATGDLLFLSDMDDVWALDKVVKVVEAFRVNPAAQIVVSSLSLIDEHGCPMPSDEFLRDRRSDPGFVANVLRNNFQGSTMAIRASLLREVLPFPKGRLYLHDQWIGTRNAVTGGEVVFLQEPLLRYRRHSSNVSGDLPAPKRLGARLQLLWDHLCRAVADLL